MRVFAVLALAATLTVSFARYKSSDFTDEERLAAAVQGVIEAKHHIQQLENEQAVELQSKKKDTSADLLAKFFRKASPKSIQLAKSRLTIEHAVKAAERRLLDSKRAQMATAESTDLAAQAEVLAQELFHTPGSLLTKKEMAHIYEEAECIDARSEIDCNLVPFADAIRTFDGTCNNLDEPTRGSSFTAFRRLVPAHYEDGLMQLNGFRQSKMEENNIIFRDGPFSPPFPSARLVSKTIIRDRIINDSLLTHLVMQWGQFLDHDLDLNVEFENPNCDIQNCTSDDVCAPIRVAEDDDNFGTTTPRQGFCLPFARTLPVCETEDFEARNPINELTHYIDGSMVYGSTLTRANFLREFSGGRLKVGPNFPVVGGRASLPTIPPCPPSEGSNREEFSPPLECCPEGNSNCFVAGDVRVNEHTSLTVIHTLWVREHNRIAAALANINPHWDDERLYQESRKIVIAQIQQITFEEFLPAILGRKFFDKLIGNYLGYEPSRDSSVPNSFATAAFRFGHSLIQNNFLRLGPNFQSISRGPLSLRDAFMNSSTYNDSEGTDPILRGLLEQPARLVDEFLNSILTTQLFEREEGMGMDLATLNIQRGRDHGLAPYPVWKKFCQNRFGTILPIAQFSNELTRIRFLQTYGSLDTSDLWPAGLAEEPIEGGVVGPTFACIFAITFSDSRFGDRFWYENTNISTNAGAFTADQLAEIKKTSLARVLCDNGDAIPLVQQNPFLLGERVLCSLFIPNINFEPFREDPLCYIRISVTPGSQNLELFVMSMGPGDPVFNNYPIIADAGSLTSEQCVPFTCPTASINTLMTVFPAFTNNDLANFLNCKLTSNSGLPSSTAPPGAESVYHATFNTQVVSTANGLSRDLISCENNVIIALTYDCSAVVQQTSTATKSTAELEEELAHILKETATKESTPRNVSRTFLPPYNINKHTDIIPDMALDLLRNATSTPTMASKEALNHQSVLKSESSSEELVDLLKKTLQELKSN